jgi:acyl-CoA synthetase (AMP-forming)/AMP-acid ligase II
MSNPLGLLPLALGARAGTVDGLPAGQLVAAGLTLLQRCPALIRAVYGRRIAILLPSSPAWLTALAASDGRAAVLLDPSASLPEQAALLAAGDVAAVLTIAELADRVPAGMLHVCLDDVPSAATLAVPDAPPRRIDLGAHTGWTLEGAEDEPGGSDEIALLIPERSDAGTVEFRAYSHDTLLRRAHDAAPDRHTTSAAGRSDAVPFHTAYGLTVALFAPLLAGAAVLTRAIDTGPLRSVDDGITHRAG